MLHRETLTALLESALESARDEDDDRTLLLLAKAFAHAARQRDAARVRGVAPRRPAARRHEVGV